MIQNTKHKKDTERQPKVDERLHIFREEKKILWHVDLGEDTSIPHQRGHPLRCRLVEIGKH